MNSSMKVRLLLLVSITLLVSACSSGKKAYERGDYYEAVMLAIGRLRQNPDHSKSKETLRNSYPQAVDWLQNDAKNQIASNSNSKWRNALTSYDKINQMYEAIRQAPGALKVIPNPKEYYSEIGPLKEKAASESYEAGITALMKGTREESKRAYFHFADAQSFVPDYKDVIEYLNKSKFEATLQVIVEQVAVPARYALSGVFFQDKIEEYLHRNYTERDFVKFHTPKEAEAIKLARVDQYLRLQFDDFSVGNVVLREKEETVTRDSVKIGETKVKEGDKTKTVPVYGTVKAKLKTYRKEVSSNGLLSMIVVDAKTNGVLKHDKFSDTYVWVNEWGNFNGDERALSSQQLAMCNRKEIQPPDAQTLFLEFAGPIYNKLTPSIRNFYQRY
jgi:hypothetical protein